MKKLFKSFMLITLLFSSTSRANDASVAVAKQEQELLKKFDNIIERLHLSLNNSEGDDELLEQARDVFFEEHVELTHLHETLNMEFVHIFLIAGLKTLLFNGVDLLISDKPVSDTGESIGQLALPAIMQSLIYTCSSRAGESPKLKATHLLEGSELFKSLGGMAAIWLVSHGLKKIIPVGFWQREQAETVINYARMIGMAGLFILLPLLKRREHFTENIELHTFIEELKNCTTKDDLENLHKKHSVTIPPITEVNK